MIDGLAVVDKPVGWTSHDVVARGRKVFGQKRVGHGGTLDPDATGVLLLGIGRVTRLLRFLAPLRKHYMGDIVLGTATSTLDASGEVTATWDMSGVTTDDVRRAAAALVGDTEQVPPMVSAVQVGGRRLYDLAREGVEVERAPRPVTVFRFDVGEPSEGCVFPFEVECSSGTYVRSLVADVGTALGGGAHLRGLRRTRVGPFSVDDAVPLEQLGPGDVVAPADAVGHLAAFTVGSADEADVAHGRRLRTDLVGPGDPGPWRVLDGTGRLLAVYERGETGVPVAAVVIAPR